MTAEPGTGRAKSGRKAGPARAGPDREIPYEQARDELTDVVRRLEAGGLTLEQSLELWERGERLAEICQQWLEGARARLAAAMPVPPGQPARDESSQDAPAPF